MTAHGLRRVLRRAQGPPLPCLPLHACSGATSSLEPQPRPAGPAPPAVQQPAAPERDAMRLLLSTMCGGPPALEPRPQSAAGPAGGPACKAACPQQGAAGATQGRQVLLQRRVPRERAMAGPKHAQHACPPPACSPAPVPRAQPPAPRAPPHLPLVPYLGAGVIVEHQASEGGGVGQRGAAAQRAAPVEQQLAQVGEEGGGRQPANPVLLDVQALCQWCNGGSRRG